MKKTGIWLDKDKAHVVTLEGENEDFKTIDSNLEHFRARGGSGTKFKGGPQDVVQDRKYTEREKHQLKDYFKLIAEAISNSDAIVLFGPAGTNDKLYKELQSNYKSLSTKVKDVVKADSMSENQIKAWVRDYFNV